MHIVDVIESLLDKNEYFYEKGDITLEKYHYNSFYLIGELEKMLRNREKKFIPDFEVDDYSFAKFNLNILYLKTGNN
ncbi:hypothetical protein CEY12_05985 [Chryseobacterium sp. T16E-39]|nr:hypothetical protein CEY12_05985 [Chryseobacterium sp. T16E-39]